MISLKSMFIVLDKTRIATAVRRASCLLVLVLFCATTLGSTALAISAEQRDLYDSGILYYDLEPAFIQGCSGSLELSGENNAVAAYNYLIANLDLTPAQVSGIIGNLMNESGANGYDLNPEVVGRGQCANGSDCRGIAQWSVQRWAALETWAEGQGLDPLTLGTQAAYIVEELENVPGHWSVTLANLQAISGHSEDAAREAAAEFNETYEIGIRTGQRQLNAATFFREHASVAGPPTGGDSSVGLSSCELTNQDIQSCISSLNPEPHPTETGYYRMPDAPNNEYHVYSVPSRRWGSIELVCALRTVALRYNEERQGASRMMIGNLNTPYEMPSRTHLWGSANDHYADGDEQAGTITLGEYSEEATITLGRLWVETGMLKNIWWCPPDAPGHRNGGGSSHIAIRNYAAEYGENGLAGEIKCLRGHHNHFHVDIRDEFRRQEYQP